MQPGAAKRVQKGGSFHEPHRLPVRAGREWVISPPSPCREGPRSGRRREVSAEAETVATSDRETEMLDDEDEGVVYIVRARAHQMQDLRIVTLLFTDVEGSTRLLGSL